MTLASGCDPAAAGAAVRRAADALLAATGDRLRRGVEVSVAQGPDGWVAVTGLPVTGS